jgi:hypothetical protein
MTLILLKVKNKKAWDKDFQIWMYNQLATLALEEKKLKSLQLGTLYTF